MTQLPVYTRPTPKPPSPRTTTQSPRTTTRPTSSPHKEMKISENLRNKLLRKKYRRSSVGG